MFRNALLFILLLTLGVESALGDQVTLKNGDHLTGKVVKSDGKNVAFKSDLLGDLTIAMENIAQLISDEPLHVSLVNGQTVVGKIRIDSDNVQVESGGNEIPIKRTEIQLIRSRAEQQAYEDSLHPRWRDLWTGGADLGMALTKGNSDTTNVALGLAMSRETLHDKTSVYAASIYNRDNTSGVSHTIANTLRFGVRYDKNFDGKLFGYGFTDLERNKLQDLNLRWVLGGGIGYHAIKNSRTQLDFLGGLAMNREYFRGFDNDRTSLDTQLGQTLSHQFNSRVSLKEQLFFFPNLSDGGEYRINFDSSLVTSITRRIGWQVTLSDRYLSNPPAGLKPNDLIMTTGLHVNLGLLK